MGSVCGGRGSRVGLGGCAGSLRLVGWVVVRIGAEAGRHVWVCLGAVVGGGVLCDGAPVGIYLGVRLVGRMVRERLGVLGVGARVARGRDHW